MRQLYAAACGQHLTTINTAWALETRFRIYFPSARTVQLSAGGIAGGSFFFLRRREWGAGSFPRACIREQQPLRNGLLSHQKLLYARGRCEDGTSFAWLYIGSANATPAAWGRVTDEVIRINNHECGVLIQVPPLQLCFDSGGVIPSMASFDEILRFPFVFPGRHYSTQLPWINM